MFSNPTSHDFVLRYNMSLHESTDDGATWSLVGVIDEGPSAYSSLVQLTNGSVAILFERSPPPNQLIFVPLNITYAVILP